MTAPDPAPVPEAPLGPDSVAEGAHRRVLSWIYGLIVTAAVLASANTKERGWVVAAYVFVTSLVYWAAESYSHLLATRTVRQRPVTAAEVRATLSEGWVLVTASYLPLLAVIVCTAFGLEVSDTIVIALGVTVVLLFVAGWRASSASGVRGIRLLLSSTVAGCFGIVMILLKFFIH
ncbi:MAG TPA: hypothetical protein VIC82_00325 [Candidatus Nanopelagicales bacterium]|jgi:hypothetical protein